MLLNNYAIDRSASALITSLSGAAISDDERQFFKDSNPLGFILFARNIENPDQLRHLCDDLKSTLGRDCPILIDQEGGRVARLKPPLWNGYPAARTYGALLASDETRAKDELVMRTKAIAKELRAGAINVNCDPVLDVLCPETHDVIGDRAYGEDPNIVANLGQIVCETYLQAGITPIIKHIPGHGRACADSHLELPIVTASHDDLRALDFVPFQHIARSPIGDKVWAMSAHILYQSLDKDLPLTLSADAIQSVIRDEIGFNGILISDDVSMKALAPYGDLGERCTKSLQAGCDLALYCAGIFDEMQQVAKSVPNLRDDTWQRLQNAATLS